MDRPAAKESSKRRLLAMALPFALFAYLVTIRTWDISRTFWFFFDQTLYWRIALGPWYELPIGGGPSQVGGTTVGPVFVWVVWLFRHLIGPFTDNLPHAGGIGISILQSLADVFLFMAIGKRFHSLLLALGVVLIAGSAPYDLALTATIWNPPVATAFAKSAIASVLLAERGVSLAWTVAATAFAVLTMQAHSAGLFLAAPLVASFTLRELLDRDWARAGRMTLITLATVAVLEVPYLADRFMNPEKVVRPVAVTDSVSSTLAHPETLRPGPSFRALVNAIDFILVHPWSFPWMAWLLVPCGLVVLYRSREDITLAGATVFPLVAAVAGFSLWQAAYDHYWYMLLAPGAMLMVALAVTAWPPAAMLTAGALAILALVVQPSRVTASRTIHRLPQYGSLVRAAREVRRYTPEVRAIGVDYDLPAGVDASFLYGVLGGRLSPAAPFDAVIHQSGKVTFMPAPGARP